MDEPIILWYLLSTILMMTIYIKDVKESRGNWIFFSPGKIHFQQNWWIHSIFREKVLQIIIFATLLFKTGTLILQLISPPLPQKIYITPRSY